MNNTRHLVFLGFIALLGYLLWKRYRPRTSLDDHFEEQSLLQDITRTAQAIETNVEPVIAMFGKFPWTEAQLQNPYAIERTTDTQADLRPTDTNRGSSMSQAQDDQQVWSQENLNNPVLFPFLWTHSN